MNLSLSEVLLEYAVQSEPSAVELVALVVDFGGITWRCQRDSDAKQRD